MRYPIVSLMVFLVGAATPVFAGGGKGPLLGKIQVKNATGVGIHLTITQDPDTLADREKMEPDEFVTVRPRGAKFNGPVETVHMTAIGLEYPIEGKSVTIDVVGSSLPGEDNCIRYDVLRVGDSYEASAIYFDWVESGCAAIIRESRVLACSSFGLLVLGCVGYRLGRAPRQRAS